MSKTTPKNEKHDFFEIKSICKTTHIRSRPVQTPRGPHPDTAYEAASCLNDLLARAEPRHLTDLPPEPVAHALLGFLRRHPRDGWFQNRGCEALHRLCEKFPELRTALQRDPSVYATVRAAAKADPSLETTHRFWYTKELCVWLQPPCLVWRGWVLVGWEGHRANGGSRKGSLFFATSHISILQQPFFSLIVVN